MSQIGCEQALALLIDFLKREVPPEVAEAVERHLEECRPCNRHARFEARFVVLLEQRLGRQCAPEHLRSRILEALREEIPPIP
jgi:anti-sigma factor (TIGR02949 family)